MDGVRCKEACKREEIICKHSHERGVRMAHFGEHGLLLFLFGSDQLFSLFRILKYERGRVCYVSIRFGFKRLFCLVVGLAS